MNCLVLSIIITRGYLDVVNTKLYVPKPKPPKKIKKYVCSVIMVNVVRFTIHLYIGYQDVTGKYSQI